MGHDPWQLAADRAHPKPKTLGDYMPPLGAISPAANAKDAFEAAQRLFEYEQALAARHRRRVNPSVEQAYWRAYELYCEIVSKESWTKPPGLMGGSRFPPRGRWKSSGLRDLSTKSDCSDASDFPRHPSAE